MARQYRLFWQDAEESPVSEIAGPTYPHWADTKQGIQYFIADLLCESGLREETVRNGYIYARVTFANGKLQGEFLGDTVGAVWCADYFFPKDRRAVEAVAGVAKRWVVPTPGLPGTYCVTVHGTGVCGHEYCFFAGGRKSEELAKEMQDYPYGRWIRVGLCANCE